MADSYEDKLYKQLIEAKALQMAKSIAATKEAASSKVFNDSWTAPYKHTTTAMGFHITQEDFEEENYDISEPEKNAEPKETDGEGWTI